MNDMKVMDYSARLVFARIPKQIVVNLAQVLYDIQPRNDLNYKWLSCFPPLTQVATPANPANV